MLHNLRFFLFKMQYILLCYFWFLYYSHFKYRVSSKGPAKRFLASLVLELHWRRGDVGCRVPPLEENVKMVVESREKFLGWVTRGEESESDVAVGCRWM